MNRALRAATVGVLLLTPVALTACGVGQVNQTATQIRDKTGPSAQIGDLSLREVLIAYPSGGQYRSGDSAELTMSIANSGPDDDALVGISGDGIDGVQVISPASSSASGSASGSAPASSSGGAASQTAGSSVGGASSNPTAASGSSSASATASGSSSSGTSLNIPVPSHSSVFIGETDAPSLLLTGLSASLRPAQSLRLTFTFQRAGQVSLDVTVSGPQEAAARSSSFDFNQEPSATTGGNG